MSSRRKDRLYSAPTRHVNESGKPSMNRGKQPHKGGYHARMKPVNPFKVWYEISTGEIGKSVRASCPWNPGKSRK